MATNTDSTSMDKRLLKAASSGDSMSMRALASQDPRILFGRTPNGNTCLHLSSIHDHQVFCTDVVSLEEYLLVAVNLDGETPLLAAVRSGCVSVASVLLQCYRSRRLSEAILKQDTDGCNALHHAIRNGHRELALELIAAEPSLSKVVDKFNESPMFASAMRDFTDVSEKLLAILDSAHMGPHGNNALHAAMRNENLDLAKRIMETRPWLARQAEKTGHTTPMSACFHRNKIGVLRVLLEHDCSLGYEMSGGGYPLLFYAACGGHIDVARELLSYCPDAPYRASNNERSTCLHVAVRANHPKFVKFLMQTPQLRKLINMQDILGKTALHYAVQKCNPKLVAILLSHEDIDATVLDKNGMPPAYELSSFLNHAKTLNWNEVCMLMLRADPRDATSFYNLNIRTKRHAINASRKDAKSLTQTYTSNTSLLAILTTTITFAAAFTLPGGYNNASGREGLPIMSQKIAFHTFLISDTLAMCSSFVVAFICIIARWEDYEFLIYYRSFTKKLMWFAYVATTTAFSTGLYTVLTPRLHWLGIAICVLVVLLPILTKLLGEWPVLKLRFRLGKTFNSNLLDMV